MKKNSTWKVVLIVLGAILAVGIFGVFWIQGFQNTAFSMEEQVEAAESSIEVQEKARVDKVINLADCVKQYDKHEAETLVAIAEGRTQDGSIENVSVLLNSITESYPQLVSNEQYKTLMNELIIIENTIAQYRENYNTQIKEYKRYVRKFPTRMFLDFLGYEMQDYTYLDYGTSPDAPTNLFD